MSKIGVIIINWNSLDMVTECLTGLREHEPNAGVYIVDNGSSDGSAEEIEQRFPDIRMIRSPANLGFAGGCNLGIQRALADECDPIVLLNNDTLIDESFLDPCLNVLNRDPKVGIVGPVVVEADQPGKIQCRGGRISKWTLNFDYLDVGEPYIRSDRVDRVGYVLGAAMVVRSAVFEELGALDPEFFPAYVEEAEFCYRAAMAGYESVVCDAARVRHIGAASGGSDQISFRRFTTNRFRFFLKHLGPVSFLIASTGLIARVTVHLIQERLRRWTTA